MGELPEVMQEEGLFAPEWQILASEAIKLYDPSALPAGFMYWNLGLIQSGRLGKKFQKRRFFHAVVVHHCITDMPIIFCSLMHVIPRHSMYAIFAYIGVVWGST